MKPLIMITILFLSGCTTITGLWQSGAKANDAALTASEAIICKGASVGAIQRKYGQDKAKASAWRELCLSDNEGRIVE